MNLAITNAGAAGPAAAGREAEGRRLEGQPGSGPEGRASRTGNGGNAATRKKKKNLVSYATPSIEA